MHSDLQALLDASPELRADIDRAVRRGLQALAAPTPLRGSQWADEHYYLSAESSYTEARWETWPFQRAIIDCMCHDEIASVTWRKPSRVGYTKILGAAVGYFHEHKRRNGVVYQPTDDDATDWCKTELNTMLRDVSVMQRVFPSYLQRNKDNTLDQKKFLGSMLHIRGGKAAKNYRRLTVDYVILDELDGFDTNIEKEGSPVKLSGKRLEGALFPKHIKGSTPKLKGFSMIDAEHDAAELQFTFQVPCPHCATPHALTWGGKHANHGFKWLGNDAATVRHLCPHCGSLQSQADYLANWKRGRWVTVDGIWIDDECRFWTAGGVEIPVPHSVAFSCWTAYSPQSTWPAIVKEFIEAVDAMRRGDHSPMQTFVNTTKGESYALEGSKTDWEVLKKRAEPFPLRRIPRAGLMVLAAVDVQDNRFEIVVWAFGRNDETWTVDYRVMYCDPGTARAWLELDTYLGTRFPHEGGQYVAIDCVGIDSGGHYTHQVYQYAMARESRRVHALVGDGEIGKAIVAGAPRKMDVNAEGGIVKAGVKLWRVGTDTAKDLLHNRLRIGQPGPGYVHFSDQLPDEFFQQITSEQRVEVRTASGVVHRWVKPSSNVRNEVLDCTVYTYFCAARMKLHQYTDAEWSRIERALCPPTADMFQPAELPPLPAPDDAIVVPSSSRSAEMAARQASEAEAAETLSALIAPPRPAGRRVRGAIA